MENRESTRVEAKLKVAIESGAYVGVTEDLSRGGMFLRTQRRFTRGTRLNLQIELSEGRAEADVEVCWLRTAMANKEIGMGVKFVQISDEMAAYLDSVEVPQNMMPVAREG